jgi:hypothetical protein
MLSKGPIPVKEEVLRLGQTGTREGTVLIRPHLHGLAGKLTNASTSVEERRFRPRKTQNQCGFLAPEGLVWNIIPAIFVS